MDIKNKKPAKLISFTALVMLSFSLGATLTSAQTDSQLATQTSFACEPLVFTLSATDEATPSGSATATPKATSTAKPSSSPTASPIGAGTGGTSPTPTSSATATAKATASSTPASGTLPDAGIGAPTIIGVAAGVLLLLAAALLAL